MFNTICRKSWVSPLIAFSFAAVGGTGLLMLLVIHLPAIEGIHEWLGLLFVVGAVLHVVLHWRTLLGYLSAPASLAALAVVLVLGLLLSTVGGKAPDHRFGAGMPPPENHALGPSHPVGPVAPASTGTQME